MGYGIKERQMMLDIIPMIKMVKYGAREFYLTREN